MQTKQCLHCGKTIIKPYICSKKDWENRKYCSIGCTHIEISKWMKEHPNKGQFKKGNKTWCEGKKPIQLSGKNHHSWNGGRSKNDAGYIFIYSPNHPYKNKRNYVREHRLVMEKYLGRYLEPREVVHHINEITDDNRLENLMLFPNNKEHKEFHKKYKLT